MNTDKLYVIVREDLDVGYAVAQSCHATFQFSKEHRQSMETWMNLSNYIAVLKIKSEHDLTILFKRAQKLGIKASIFREPDLNDEATAIVLEPGILSKQLCNKYKLFGT